MLTILQAQLTHLILSLVMVNSSAVKLNHLVLLRNLILLLVKIQILIQPQFQLFLPAQISEAKVDFQLLQLELNLSLFNHSHNQQLSNHFHNQQLTEIFQELIIKKKMLMKLIFLKLMEHISILFQTEFYQ